MNHIDVLSDKYEDYKIKQEKKKDKIYQDIHLIKMLKSLLEDKQKYYDNKINEIIVEVNNIGMIHKTDNYKELLKELIEENEEDVPIIKTVKMCGHLNIDGSISEHYIESINIEKDIEKIKHRERRRDFINNMLKQIDEDDDDEEDKKEDKKEKGMKYYAPLGGFIYG